jgi:prepilin-type N-terminal cleavage/methylation domain-containing protein
MKPQRLRTQTREGKCLAGFSLLELIIVMLILGIVSAIAIPKYSASLDRYRTQVALQRFAQDIELCRRHARFTSQNVTLTVSYAKNSYSLSPLDSPLQPGKPYAVFVGDNSVRTLLCPVIQGIVTNGTQSSQTDLIIVFDRYGTPNQAADIGILCGMSSGIIRLSAQGVVTRS